MRSEAFILFFVIALLLAFGAMVAFDVDACHDQHGVFVQTFGGYRCLPGQP